MYTGAKACSQAAFTSQSSVNASEAKRRMRAQPCTQTYPAVQVLEPGGMLVPHGQILVQNLAGLLHLKLLHAEEAEDEGGVQAHAADVRLGLEPFPHLSQGALTHFRLLLQMAKKTLIS